MGAAGGSAFEAGLCYARWRAFGVAFLPGFLLGAHLAALVFFLNPRVPFTLWGVGQAMLLYGSMLGGCGAALQMSGLWLHPARAPRWLPWTLTLALGLGAVLDAAHASFYAYFLPPGINVRLLKTALWLALGGLIAFYTALLHTLNNRPYGWRSRWALGLIACLSLVAAVERRDAFRPPSAERPTMRPFVEQSVRHSLWVIALDSASLDAILPLAGQGRLPNISALLRQGAYGRLETLGPNRRPALWTTLATGKYPWKTGITGESDHSGGLAAPGAELNLLPRGIGFRVWGLLGPDPTPEQPRRRALFLWEICARLGFSPASVGWPSSWPPGKGGGAVVSERFFRSDEARSEAKPPSFRRQVESLRVRVTDLDPVSLKAVGQRPSESLRAALAGDLWRERVALEIGQASSAAGVPSPVFVALPGLRSMSEESFGGFLAAQFGGDASPRSEEAARSVADYYEHLDRFLGQLLASQKDAMVAIVSAHGSTPIGWWERVRGGGSLRGSFEGAPDGALILAGPGIRAGALIAGPKLVDVVPTLLYALGLPVARDLDGQVLTGAFDASFLAHRPLAFLPSYEALPPEKPVKPTYSGFREPPALAGSPR